MKGSKTDYIGKRMDWKSMVDNIADMWVVIGDYEFEHGIIKDGIIEDILPDNEIRLKRSGYLDKGFICIRTTNNLMKIYA